MKPVRLLLIAALLTGASLTGCDDPSNVGFELIDTQSGTPEVVELSPAVLPVTSSDVTRGTQRILIGTVDDPATGRISAAAVIQFASPTLSTEFQNADVSSAELRLVRNYRYGDTTSTVSFNVREMLTSWDDLTIDTRAVPASGSTVIGSGTATATDSLAIVPLDATWVTANSALLKATDFEERFLGFYLDASGGNAVIGFSQSGVLRLTSSAGTADYTLHVGANGVRNLTVVSRESVPPPDGRILLQDGTAEALEIDIDPQTNSLSNAAVNRVNFEVAFDTLITPPANFVRGRPARVEIAGVANDLPVTTIASAVQSGGKLVFESVIMRLAVQDVLVGKSPFDRLVLHVAPADNTINAIFLRSGPPEEGGPRLTLTVVKP